MSTIYLVEGEWTDCDGGEHWAVVAFTTLAAAESHREKCQAWIDSYVDQFWDAYEAEFGKVDRKDSFRRCLSGVGIGESERRLNFYYRWFENSYTYESENSDGVLDTTCGRSKMRQLSPDPQVELDNAVPCIYSVVELDLDPSGHPESRRLGPRCSAKTFEDNYCIHSGITEKFYADHLVTLRCFCDDDKCPGWAAVNKDSEYVARHQELYGGA